MSRKVKGRRFIIPKEESLQIYPISNENEKITLTTNIGVNNIGYVNATRK